MKLSLHRWLNAMAVAGLVVAFAGCAGTRSGDRLSTSNRATQVASEARQPVQPQVALPSQQAVRPASVQMPPEGQFNQQDIEAIRRGRPVGLFAPQGRACHS